MLSILDRGKHDFLPTFGLSLLPLLACGGDAGGAEGALSAKGQSFEVSVTLNPDPPVVGNNDLDIVLSDRSGAKVSGASIVVSPWMPAHGHGTSDVTATEGDTAGSYTASDVRFHMVGEWDLRMNVSADGKSDAVVVTVQVR